MYWFPEGSFDRFPGRQFQLTRRVAHTVPVVVIDEESTQVPLPPSVRITPSDEPGIAVATVRLHRVWRSLRRRRPALVSRMIGRRLRRALHRSGRPTEYVFWYAGIQTAGLSGMIAGPLVIDLIDPPYGEHSKRTLRERLRTIDPQGDVFFATAGALAEEALLTGAAVHLIPNGCESVRTAPLPLPATATVGYLGTLDWRFDWDLVESVARSLPETRRPLAGRVLDHLQARAAELGSLPNVEIRSTDAELSDFEIFREFSVAIIPFRLGFDGDAINPVKMYEYLAQGLPVLSTPIRECREHEPLVTCRGWRGPVGRSHSGIDRAPRGGRGPAPGLCAIKHLGHPCGRRTRRPRAARHGGALGSTRRSGGRVKLAVVRDTLEDRELANYVPLAAEGVSLQFVSSREAGRYSATGLGVDVVRLRRIADFLRPAGVQRRLVPHLDRVVDSTKLQGLDRMLFDADVACVNETHTASAAQVCRLKEDRPNLAVVVVVYENIPFRYEDDPGLAARKDLVRGAADLFIALTPEARSALREEGVDESRIALQPYGVDATRFGARLRDDALRARWGASGDACVVLFAGRLLREKGLAALLRASRDSATTSSSSSSSGPGPRTSSSGGSPIEPDSRTVRPSSHGRRRRTCRGSWRRRTCSRCRACRRPTGRNNSDSR